MQKGTFIISLDFELAWGFHYSSKARGPYRDNILGARAAIPKLLYLFDKYGIHVTWATVGALACNSKSQLIRLIDQDIEYLDHNYSVYQYIEKHVGENEETDPMHYAPSLIDLIRKHPNQYIGSHTFSHFFLWERTSNEDDFEKDITAVKAVFPEASTIVFARNQYSKDAIDLLKNYGFKGYRGIPENNSIINIYEESKKTPLIRALRLVDTYFPVTGHYDFTYEELKSGKGELLNIRASSTLRPYNPSLKFLEQFKLSRIQKGMIRAAANSGIYHLYWHPHNFGVNQEENLQLLEKILQYYLELHQRYGMVSKSMEEVCEDYLQDKAY